MADGTDRFSGSVLRVRRRRTSLTIDDLAALVGVTEGAVSAWERGLAYPTPGHLAKLAAALLVTPADLCAGGGQDPSLADLRVMAGLTLVEAAAKSRVSRTAISRYERGTHPVPAHALELLAAAYEVDPDVVEAASRLTVERRIRRARQRHAQSQ